MCLVEFNARVLFYLLYLKVTTKKLWNMSAFACQNNYHRITPRPSVHEGLYRPPFCVDWHDTSNVVCKFLISRPIWGLFTFVFTKLQLCSTRECLWNDSPRLSSGGMKVLPIWMALKTPLKAIYFNHDLTSISVLVRTTNKPKWTYWINYRDERLFITVAFIFINRKRTHGRIDWSPEASSIDRFKAKRKIF